jgi:hypothetical protein
MITEPWLIVLVGSALLHLAAGVALFHNSGTEKELRRKISEMRSANRTKEDAWLAKFRSQEAAIEQYRVGTRDLRNEIDTLHSAARALARKREAAAPVPAVPVEKKSPYLFIGDD